MEIRRIAFALGAEVSGCDLRRPLSEDAERDLRRALFDHQVLVFHKQRLEPDELLRLAQVFGPLAPMRDEDEILEGQPNIIRLSNAPNSVTRGYGQEWHADGVDFLAVPDGMTFLNCLECPALGGDTLFSNLYLVYESLTPAYRELLGGLHWHVPLLRMLAHPLVRMHGETKRSHLYLPGAQTQFCGMTAAESGPILQFLSRLRADPRFVYRHRWQVGDLVIWENATTNHKVAEDTDHTEPRTMNRTRTKGTLRPRRVHPFSGDPADRALLPTDVLTVVPGIRFERRTEEGVERAYLCSPPNREIAVNGKSAIELVERFFRARRFVAEQARFWVEPATAWAETAAFLQVFHDSYVLSRDVSADSRVPQPGRV